MTTDYAGDSTTFDALVQTPSDGEKRTAASVQVPLEQLANRTAYNQDQADRVLPAIHSVKNWQCSDRSALASSVTGNKTAAVAGNGQYWLSVGGYNGVETSAAWCRNAALGWTQLVAADGVGTFEGNDVCWDETNGLFIFVGNGGNIRTGEITTYAPQSSGGATDLNAVHTSTAGVTCAAGDYDGADVFAVRAIDGITYSAVAVAASSGDKANAIASNGATFLIVGETSGGSPLLWRSTDSAATFAAVSPPGGFTDAAIKVVYDGSGFLVAGDADQIMYSATGAVGTWSTLTDLAFDAGTFRDMDADASTGMIVAISDQGEDRFLYSVDSGTSWTTVPYSSVAAQSPNDWNAIAFGSSAWAVAHTDFASDDIHSAQSMVV